MDTHSNQNDGAPLSSVFMGAESLLVQCAELFLDKGNRIQAVITDDAQIRAWAVERKIPVVPPGAGLGERLAPMGTYDYFFSVANLRIVPEAVVAAAARGGINFHDGPLPAYAGLNAPIWAISEGEKTHGVTWHEMTGEVDTGRILAQARFDIDPGETALTLNTKCYEHAIETFAVLVEGLMSGGLTPQEQDLSQRSYFGLDHRPTNEAILDFNQGAEELARWGRALDCGTYANPVAMVKIATPSGTVLARQVQIVDATLDSAVLEATAQTDGSPGRILDISNADAATPAMTVGTQPPRCVSSASWTRPA